MPYKLQMEPVAYALGSNRHWILANMFLNNEQLHMFKISLTTNFFLDDLVLAPEV